MTKPSFVNKAMELSLLFRIFGTRLCAIVVGSFWSALFHHLANGSVIPLVIVIIEFRNKSFNLEELSQIQELRFVDSLLVHVLALVVLHHVAEIFRLMIVETKALGEFADSFRAQVSFSIDYQLKVIGRTKAGLLRKVTERKQRIGFFELTVPVLEKIPVIRKVINIRRYVHN